MDPVFPLVVELQTANGVRRRYQVSQVWVTEPAWVDGAVDPPTFYHSREEIEEVRAAAINQLPPDHRTYLLARISAQEQEAREQALEHAQRAQAVAAHTPPRQEHGPAPPAPQPQTQNAPRTPAGAPSCGSPAAAPRQAAAVVAAPCRNEREGIQGRTVVITIVFTAPGQTRTTKSSKTITVMNAS